MIFSYYRNLRCAFAYGICEFLRGRLPEYQLLHVITTFNDRRRLQLRRKWWLLQFITYI